MALGRGIMQLDNNWHSVTGPATAEALVKRLAEALGSSFELAVLSRIDGIPSLELSRSKSVLSIGEVVRTAKRVRDAAQCAVHFHQLRGTDVTFLVYHPCLRDGTYTHAQLKDYGVPLSEWLPNVLRDGVADSQFASL